jgi:ABC-type antimicrobial peptide transport system permease subunit
MIKEHTRMALGSIKSQRVRSAMTMFGIIISVASVITVVGLGQGLRQQVTKQIGKLGSNLIIVQPGRRSDGSALNLQSLERVGGVSTGMLTEQDLVSVSKVEGIDKISPVASIAGLATYENRKLPEANIIGASEDLPTILDKKIEYGAFFNKNETLKNYAVIGRGVAENLFEENVPIGKTFQIRGVEFIVQGVFEQTPLTPLSPSVNFNNAVVISYPKAKEISNGNIQISQILTTTKTPEQTPAAAKAITTALLANHGGQEDFSVLRQEETLAISDGVFDQLTMFVTGVAIIALLVGGIGIMNIMFASVSERTREIGIRKAVGATNKQIMNQFITEAVVLSVSGGVFGVITAFIILVIVRSTTSLEPTLVLSAVAIALGISIAIGIVSGILPALKASRKDPIDALRGL